MAEQKQEGRRQKGGGKDKKKQEPPKSRRRSNWSIDRKLANVQRHLAQDARRAEKAKMARTPHGMARLERRSFVADVTTTMAE